MYFFPVSLLLFVECWTTRSVFVFYSTCFGCFLRRSLFIFSFLFGLFLSSFFLPFLQFISFHYSGFWIYLPLFIPLLCFFLCSFFLLLLSFHPLFFYILHNSYTFFVCLCCPVFLKLFLSLCFLRFFFSRFWFVLFPFYNVTTTEHHSNQCVVR